MSILHKKSQDPKYARTLDNLPMAHSREDLAHWVLNLHQKRRNDSAFALVQRRKSENLVTYSRQLFNQALRRTPDHDTNHNQNIDTSTRTHDLHYISLTSSQLSVYKLPRSPSLIHNGPTPQGNALNLRPGKFKGKVEDGDRRLSERPWTNVKISRYIERSNTAFSLRPATDSGEIELVPVQSLEGLYDNHVTSTVHRHSPQVLPADTAIHRPVTVFSDTSLDCLCTVHHDSPADDVEGVDASPGLPDFICPSSQLKSRESRLRYWIRNTTFTHAMKQVPVY